MVVSRQNYTATSMLVVRWLYSKHLGDLLEISTMWFTFSTALFLFCLEKSQAFDISAPYVRVGCYADKSNSSRPLPDLLENFYFSMTWNTIEEVVQNCSRLAQRRGHRYFGLQHYGECWSGKDAEIMYARDGSSEDCVNGVGKMGANFIYKLVNSLHQSCDLGWYASNNMCFHISLNSIIITDSQAVQYCKSYRGLFHLSNSGPDFLTQDRLIATLRLNNQLNTTNCLVLSNTSVPYNGVLSTWNESRNLILAGNHTASSLGTSHECAIKDIDGKWYHHACDLRDCSVVCSRRRDIPPTQGSFRMVRRDAEFQNNILKRLLVDDVTQCARECLVTDTCASFNYEYKSSMAKVGSLCALNDRKMSDSVSDLKESGAYNYYERLR